MVRSADPESFTSSDHASVEHTSAMIKNGEIVDADIAAAAAIAHSKLGTRTRELFIPPGIYTTGTPEALSFFSSVLLADAASQDARVSFKVPDDFISFTSLTLVWSGTSGTAGQDWRCDPYVSYAASGEVSNTHAETPADLTIDVPGTSKIYITDVGFTMSDLAVGDYVGVTIMRVGSHGEDTFGGPIHIIGMVLTYVGR